MDFLPEDKKERTNVSGQALLIVMLAMAVVLTAALSVASRSVVDITTTTYEEDAYRAFSAAEAGVEQALIKQEPVSATLDPNANVGFVADLTNPIPGNTYNYPEPLAKGDTATFWFVEHNNTDNTLTCGGGNCTRTNRLNFCWGNNSAINSTTPALEISIYYSPTQHAFANPNNFNDLQVIRLTYDPNNSRTSRNGFNSAHNGCSYSDGYTFQTNPIQLTSFITSCAVSSSNCLVMAKARMFYNSTPQPLSLIATGGNNAELPAQGFQVESEGKSGESVRNLNVVRTYSEPQGVFDAAVFSRNNLTKP